MAYAEKTKVPIFRSQEEIKRTLTKYNATGFAFGESVTTAMIIFEINGLRVRFNLPMPAKPSNNSTGVAKNKFDQECRSKWRSLALAIKAKLECVDAGITTIEEEFMAHIVMPNGENFGAWATPQITDSYKNKKMPPLLGMR